MKKWIVFGLSLCTTLLLAGLAFIFFVVAPGLPTLEAVTDYRPKIPLRIYTADNALIGEFGEEHRDFVPIKQIPAVMKNALLSIEDARFYEHGGVSFISAGRAILADLSRGFHQGASTITMQVARNFFLTNEKSLERKMKEILLTYRIEDALSKDQILELYMNQISWASAATAFPVQPRLILANRWTSSVLQKLPCWLEFPKTRCGITQPSILKKPSKGNYWS